MILLLDANENMKNENLEQAIISEQTLKMKELFREMSHKDGPATCFLQF